MVYCSSGRVMTRKLHTMTEPLVDEYSLHRLPLSTWINTFIRNIYVVYATRYWSVRRCKSSMPDLDNAHFEWIEGSFVSRARVHNLQFLDATLSVCCVRRLLLSTRRRSLARLVHVTCDQSAAELLR